MGRIERIAETLFKGGQKLIKKRNLPNVTNPIIAEAKNAEAVGVDLVSISSKSKSISAAEFDNLTSKIEGLQYDWASLEEIRELAKLSDGTFNKEVLDLYQRITNVAKKRGTFLMNPDDIISFAQAKSGEFLNPKLQSKIIEIFENTKTSGEVMAIENLFSGVKREDVVLKEAFADLISEILPTIKEVDRPGCFGDSTVDLFKEFMKYSGGNTENVIKKIKNMYNNAPIKDLNYLSQSIENSYGSVPEYILKLIDSGIIPNKKVIELYNTNPAILDKALLGLKKFNFETTTFKEEYFVNEVLHNNESLIRRYISEYDGRYKFMSASTDIYDSSKFVLKFKDSNYKGVLLQFDKKTQRLIYKQNINITPAEFNRVTSVNGGNKVIEQSYLIDNGCGILKSETVTTAKDKIYMQQSSVEGAMDIYRVGKSGKIEVLSKAFIDPITGETVVKRNLKSNGGTKSDYRYASATSETYNLSYRIKDKAGNELMNISRSVEKLGENHFIHNINGEKYEVITNGNFIRIIDNKGKKTVLNLKKLVPDCNPDIIATLKELPADDLIAIKKFNVPYIEIGEESAAYLHFNNGIQKISIAGGDKRSLATILHELGHVKQTKFTKANYEKIIETYTKELSLYKQKTHCTDNITMGYLIENSEHYLAEEGRYGALEEVISDVNFLIKYPNDSRDISERTIKFMEQFPETIAEITKYL